MAVREFRQNHLREAIKNGIVKVNVATETKNTFTQTLKEALNKSEEIDLRKTFPVATNAVKELIVGKMKIISMIQTEIND